MAREELAFEVCHSEDPKQQEEENWDHHYIEDSWARIDKWENSNLQPFVSRDHSERSEHSQDSQDFDELEVDIDGAEWNNWESHNEEIKNIPSVS